MGKSLFLAVCLPENASLWNSRVCIVTTQHGGHAIVLCCTTYRQPAISSLPSRVAVHTVSSNNSVFSFTPKEAFSAYETIAAKLFVSGSLCRLNQHFVTCHKSNWQFL